MESLTNYYDDHNESFDGLEMSKYLQSGYRGAACDCSLRLPAVANAFLNGRSAEQNGRHFLVN